VKNYPQISQITRIKLKAESYPQISHINKLKTEGSPVKSASLHIFDIFNWAGPGYKPGADDQNRVKIDEMEAVRLTLP